MKFQIITAIAIAIAVAAGAPFTSAVPAAGTEDMMSPHTARGDPIMGPVTCGVNVRLDRRNAVRQYGKDNTGYKKSNDLSIRRTFTLSLLLASSGGPLWYPVLDLLSPCLALVEVAGRLGAKEGKIREAQHVLCRPKLTLSAPNISCRFSKR
ncbi:hypothetical protein V8F20_010406 [Naviculisporaceae sp. PSN 640]